MAAKPSHIVYSVVESRVFLRLTHLSVDDAMVTAALSENPNEQRTVKQQEVAHLAFHRCEE